MSQPELKADKIHSPIQLMAAWFVMLILLSSVLLTAASQIDKPAWAAGYLVISTTAVILAVLSSVLLMLTKFRPHLQEGKEYAEWLKDKNKFGAGRIPTETENRLLSKLQQRFEELQREAVDESQITLIEKFKDTVLYTVSICDLDGANEIIESMQELGLKASIYEESSKSTSDDSQAIWLGSNIPAEIAIAVIKKAIRIWPHLKYISLSSDSAGPEEAYWAIYLGGATSTAIEEGLKPWSNEEMNNLQFDNTTEFHAAIRAKYP